MVVPMPTATPSTAAASGFSAKRIAFRNRWTGGVSSASICGGVFMKSTRSLPAVKFPPSPVNSTTRIAASSWAETTASAMTAYMAWVSAFFFSGRAMVIVRTPFASSTRTCSVMTDFLHV